MNIGISSIANSGAVHAMSGASAGMPPQQKMSSLFDSIAGGSSSITQQQFAQAFQTMDPPAVFQQQGPRVQSSRSSIRTARAASPSRISSAACPSSWCRCGLKEEPVALRARLRARPWPPAFNPLVRLIRPRCLATHSQARFSACRYKLVEGQFCTPDLPILVNEEMANTQRTQPSDSIAALQHGDGREASGDEALRADHAHRR